MALAVTNRLVQHGVEKLGLDQKHLKPETRNEDEVRKHFADAIVEGKIDAAEIADLTKKEADQAESRIEAMVAAAVSSAVTKSFEAFSARFGNAETATGESGSSTGGTKAVGDSIVISGAKGGDGASSADGSDIRVKGIKERFNTDESPVYFKQMKASRGFNGGETSHVIGGDGGIAARELRHPSEWTKAVAGVTAKRMARLAYKSAGLPVPKNCQETELDRQIWVEALHTSKWIGPVGGLSDGYDGEQAAYGHAEGSVLKDFQIKAMLDDVTSGGLEAVPIEFDSAVITTPLLQRELWPLVNETLTTRRRIEGFSIGNFTFNRTAEGTSIPLFDTDSFIAAFDTTIHPVTGAVEFGLDFVSDSPVAIGALMLSRYAVAYGKEMDDLIAAGTGTNEMLGLINTVGITAVDSTEGASGPHRVTDYENLLFAVPKEFRSEAGASRSIFLSNERSYQRSRQIRVDTTSADTDQRRLLVGDHKNYEDYMTAGHPHKINESLSNADVGFFCMNRFRLYRRAGFQTIVETAGSDLRRRNMGLIVVRARVGGQMELAAAGALIDDQQS
jgi:HK97 family phage major capsid protein